MRIVRRHGLFFSSLPTLIQSVGRHPDLGVLELSSRGWRGVVMTPRAVTQIGEPVGHDTEANAMRQMPCPKVTMLIERVRFATYAHLSLVADRGLRRCLQRSPSHSRFASSC
jgi:hypothetical protein